MGKKVIDEIIEESVEEIKEEIIEEIKEEVRNEVKENVKNRIKACVIKELTEVEENISVDKQERDWKELIKYNLVPVVTAFIAYALVAYLYLAGMRLGFYLLAKYTVFSAFTTAIIYFVVLLIFLFLYVIVGFYFYRLKQNKNTVLLYGTFEVSFGIVTITVAGLSFMGDIFITGVKITSFIAFYGAIYVIVRGLENTKTHYKNLHKNPVVFKVDLSKETKIEKYFSKYLKFE